MVYFKSVSSLIHSFCITVLLLFLGKPTAHARDREEDSLVDSTDQVIIDFSTLDSRSFFNGSNSPADSTDSTEESSTEENQQSSDSETETTGTKPVPESTGEASESELEHSTPSEEPPNLSGQQDSGQPAVDDVLDSSGLEQQRIRAEQNRIIEEQRRKKDAELLQRELAAANQLPETKGCLSVVVFFIAGSATGAFSLFRFLI